MIFQYIILTYTVSPTPALDECDWIDEYLFGNGITIIEWADNIKNILPEGTIRVEIKAYPEKGEDYREIKIC